MNGAPPSLASELIQWRRRLRQDPADGEARLAIAQIYQDLGRGEDLRALLGEGAPGPEWLLEFGRRQWEEGRRNEALAVFQAAREGWPESSEAAYREAFALMHLRRLEEARLAFRRGAAAFPGEARFPFQRGWIEALQGDLKEGLASMECRSALRTPPPELPIPLWAGGDPAGKHLLLRVDQGFGDVIMTCRFAPLLARAGAQVCLETPPELAELLATLEGPVRLVRQGDQLSGPLEQAPLMSLPHLLGTTLDTIPAAPYLSVPAASPHRGPIAQALDALPPGPRVGLAWAGNPEFPLTRDRDLDVGELNALASLEGVHWVSLQKGPAPVPGFPLLDLAPLLEDFTDTAFALSRLDLVITIDSAVAHLAGALGRPAWLMLPFLPDWRWLLDRSDSPWYPSLRLWRQAEARQWGPVVEAIGAE
jgi:hypothetical protein